MKFIIRGWKGDERLWKVTWLGYLGGAFIVAIAAIGLYPLLQDASAWNVGPAIIVLNVWGLVAVRAECQLENLVLHGEDCRCGYCDHVGAGVTRLYRVSKSPCKLEGCDTRAINGFVAAR